MLRDELPDDERDQADGRDDGEDGDVPRREPVLGLPPLEDDLERAQPGDEEPDPGPVDLVRPPGVRGLDGRRARTGARRRARSAG